MRNLLRRHCKIYVGRNEMRADAYLALHGFADSRERAKKMIEEGRVSVNGVVISKPSKDILDSDSVDIKTAERYEYVSRGGYKLEAALEHFGIDLCGLTCADLGASSGGFSDCLLCRGAKKIYAVDCGSGQLAKKLREDERVVSIENTNARFIDSELFGEKVDIAVMDLSFISQTLVFPAVSKILKDGGLLVSLIKPQFEVGKSGVGKNGIVKNEKFRAQAVEKVVENARLFGLFSRGVTDSPIKGGDGNVEYLTVFDFNQSVIQGE